MSFVHKKNIIITIILFLLLSANLSFAQQQGGQTMYATITSPSKGEFLSVANMDPIDTRDPFYQKTTAIKGIAQRNTDVSVYVFSRVPELIQNFTASVQDKKVTFQWQPRDVFYCKGEGCKGNTYFKYVRPGEPFSLEHLAPKAPSDRLNATFCPSANKECSEEEYLNDITSQGGVCTYDYHYSITWFNDKGKTITPENIIETEKKAHTYTIQIKEITTAEWEDKKTGEKCPSQRSSWNPFISQTYAMPKVGGGGSHATPPGPGGNVVCIVQHCKNVGAKTVTEKKVQVLVDDFDRYELYYGENTDSNLVSQKETAPASFFTRVFAQENTDNTILGNKGVSRYTNSKIWESTDPLKNNVTLSDIEPSKNYRFALFEVRRETDYQHTPYPVNADNSRAPINLSGYLYTAKNQNGGNEIILDAQGIRYPSSSDTKEKVELEAVQKNIKTDQDEHFSLDLSTMALNPASRTHFVAAFYQATDVVSDTANNPNAIGVKGSSKIAFFDVNDIEGGQWVLHPKMSYAHTAPSSYGIAYDAWTLEPLSNVTLETKGIASVAGVENTNYTYHQQTNEDGQYAFYMSNGNYTILPIAQENQQIFFPAKGCIASTQEPYREMYKGENIVVTENKALHFDIPLGPTLCGKASPESMIIVRNKDTNRLFSTTSFPDGKFSFFVPEGAYVFEKIIDKEGTEKPLSSSVTVSKDRGQEVNL